VTDDCQEYMERIKRMCDVAEARKLPMLPMGGYEGYLVEWENGRGWVLKYQGGEITQNELLRTS
jgi:hypothetical protein